MARTIVRRAGPLAVALICATADTAVAQWLSLPIPGTPRTANGEANLSAPTPRTTDGKPDLSGARGVAETGAGGSIDAGKTMTKTIAACVGSLPR